MVLYFSDDLTSLVIDFDRTVEIVVDETLTCSTILSSKTLAMIGGEDAKCIGDDTKLDSILVSLPETATIMVDTPIQFNDGVIVTKGPAYSYSVPSNLMTISAANAVEPIVVLVGPTSIPSCGQARFSAIDSMYAGYRALQYHWSIHTRYTMTAGFAEVANMLSALSPDTHEVSIHNGQFVQGMVYTVLVEVTNAIGLTGRASITMVKDTLPTLQISVSGPEERVLTPGQSLQLEGEPIVDSCIGLNEVEYQWTLSKLIDSRQLIYEEVELTDNVYSNNAMLYLPSDIFTPSSKYLIELQVTSGDQITTKTVKVTILAEQCQAKTHGGDRTISQPQTMLLDASSSVVYSDSPTYTWQCVAIGTGLPCYNASMPNLAPIAIPKHAIVTFSSKHLLANQSYQFTVLVSDGECSSSATVAVHVVAEGELHSVVQILTPIHEYQSSQVIALEGLVYLNSPSNVTWSCVPVDGQGYIDLNSNAASSPTLYISSDRFGADSVNSTLIEGQTNRANLVLYPNVLSPGLQYTLQLTARSGKSEVFSQITIVPTAPPQIHSFTITPGSGKALGTTFELTVDRVTDSIDDYPLLYQYGIAQSGTTYWLTGGRTDRSINIHLPQGDAENGNKLQVLVRVYDATGEYSDEHSEVIVTSASVGYLSFLSQVETDLAATKQWDSAMGDLTSALLSFNNANSAATRLMLDLYEDIYNNYGSNNLAQASRMLSTLELIASKTNLSMADKLDLLDLVGSLLDLHLSKVANNFQTSQASKVEDATGLPIHLNSDRRAPNDPLYAYFDDQLLHVVGNTLSYLFESSWNAAMATQLSTIAEKLSNIYCRQTVEGSDLVSFQTSNLRLSFRKSPPFGAFDASNGVIVDFSTSLDSIYENVACTSSNTACSEVCFTAFSSSVDYFSSPSTNDQMISLSASAQLEILSQVEGSHPEEMTLISDVTAIDLSLPTQDDAIEVQQLSSSIHIHIPAVQEATRENGSTPLCLYRESSSEWKIDMISPPPVLMINGVSYYQCQYNHLTQFAVGLLPPPIIPMSSSMIYVEPSPSPSPSPTYSTAMTTPPPVTPVPVDNTGAVVGSIMAVLVILIIAAVVTIFLIYFIIWRKKRSGKLKIVPALEEEQPIIADDRDSQNMAVKVSMGIIQLLENGERSLLGSISVLPSVRLRELRNQLIDMFDEIKDKKFFLCTKELCDIDPASEQQQFVSIVYSNIIYIRETTGDTDELKAQFCICNSVAEFTCSGCGVRGYCSAKCQQRHWVTGHQKECRRLSERRNRSEIIIRNTQDGATSPVTSPTNWKGFLKQSQLYQKLPRQQPHAPLPPVPTMPQRPTATALEELDAERQGLDATSRSIAERLHRLSNAKTEESSQTTSSAYSTPAVLPSQASRISLKPLQLPSTMQPRASLQSRTSLQSPFEITPLTNTFAANQFQQDLVQSAYQQQRQSVQYYDSQQPMPLPPIQTPLFSRAPPPARYSSSIPQQRPLDLSISSVQSEDLTIPAIPKRDLRQDTIREETESSSPSTSTLRESDEERLLAAEKVADETTRPPSLSVRRRTSHEVRESDSSLSTDDTDDSD